MSDQLPPPETPAEQFSGIDVSIPGPPERADYSAVIVGDATSVPAYVVAASKEALFAETYRQLLAIKHGYCYLFVNGERLLLSAPVPVFYAQRADGSLEKIEGVLIKAFDLSGRFDVNI